MSEALRQSLVNTARAMNASGINCGTSGNLSARSDEGLLITPSGVGYEGLRPADIVQVGLDGEVTGGGRPSSEWRFHRDLYRERDDIGAIVHAHPVHATALACLDLGIPAFHYMVAVAGGRDIRCARYATFGTQELSDHVVAAMQGRKACLMAHHGLLAMGPDPAGALALAIEVERLAETYLACLAVGEPAVLDEAEMDRVIEKFQNYGKP